jgi:murein DD-endopeptidase MepM/ murein hydrolase activator NlpD
LRAILALLLVVGASRTADAQFQATAVGPDVISPGDAFLIRVGCECDVVSGSAQTTLVQRLVPLVRDRGTSTWRALVGADLETRPGAYSIEMTLTVQSGPSVTVTHPFRVVERQFPTRRLRVAPAFVNPPARFHQRIADEAARLEKVMRQITPEGLGVAFQPPIATTSSSNFGSRSIYNGQARSPHAGLDFSGAVGTPILAPGPALVVLAGDLYFTGLTVVLDHGYGLFSILAHLSEIAVEAGTRVERGAVVGSLGATGRVTGPHLHWGVRLHGARVDPQSVLRVLAGP